MTGRSESIEKLAEALALAQAKIEGAAKDRENPHFKSRYADLASIWDACRAPLTENGLSVVQTTRMGDPGLMLVTTLLHTSGQWIAGELPVGADPRNPQSMGSWLTYARRYALAAIAGVCPDDDDGEAATGRQEPRGRRERPARDDATAPAGDFPRMVEPPAETWSKWVGRRIAKANADWLREMVREGVEPQVRQQHRELSNEFREVNQLVTRLIELGEVPAEAVAKSDKPGVRDPKRALDVVRGLFERRPKSIKRGVENHLKQRLNEERADLGLPDPDAHEVSDATATADGTAAPRTGKALFLWAKEEEKRLGVGLLKYLIGWAKYQEFPARMVEWDGDQVSQAYSEALRKLQTLASADGDAYEEALSN